MIFQTLPAGRPPILQHGELPGRSLSHRVFHSLLLGARSAARNPSRFERGHAAFGSPQFRLWLPSIPRKTARNPPSCAGGDMLEETPYGLGRAALDQISNFLAYSPQNSCTNLAFRRSGPSSCALPRPRCAGSITPENKSEKHRISRNVRSALCQLRSLQCHHSCTIQHKHYFLYFSPFNMP